MEDRENGKTPHLTCVCELPPLGPNERAALQGDD